MIHTSFKHGVRLAGCAVLLLVLTALVNPAYAQEPDPDALAWSDWASVTDGYQDLIVYRTVTHADTLNESGYRTEFEVYNQYGFSVNIAIEVTIEDPDGEPYDDEVEVHVGPDTTVQGTMDADHIVVISTEDLSIHAGDPIPQ
jgi:hypothetical protein